MKRKPARRPSCSSASTRSGSAKVPRTVKTIAADPAKQIAFAPNTTLGSSSPATAPPSSGPSRAPALRPIAMVLLAQATSSTGTRLGTAAVDAEKYGDWAIALMNASAISASGWCVNAITPATPAAASSEAIITRRRSMRSPSAPRSGVKTPEAPMLTNSAADIHTVECVAA